METSGTYFEYAGRDSRDYGLMLANVETSRRVNISGKTSSVVSYSKLAKKNYYIGTSYEEAPMQFEAEVVSETPLDRGTQRAVEKWLFHRDGYKKLFVDFFEDFDCETYEFINGELKRTYLNCRLVNPDKLEYNGGVVGYKFTIECDSHLAWQEPVTMVYEVGSTDDVGVYIEVPVDTDSDDYTYPEVVVTTGSGCTGFQIVNETDDASRVTSFVGDIPDSMIRMTPSVGFVTDGYYDLFIKKNFVRLLDGDNTLFITGDVQSIQITWQNMRYV